MTKKEQKFRRQTKKRLQAEGIIPPDKPKLNRKRYVEEARTQWSDTLKNKGYIAASVFLNEAIAVMLNDTDSRGRLTQQAVGTAKCLKLANRLQEFDQMVKDRGDSKFEVSEQYDYIKDILNE